MSVKSKTMKTLAVVTAAGALTVGGATVAMAADASGSGGAATATQRLRNHPGIRHALRAAFGAAADTLGTTAKDLRTQMVENHQSLADVAGDRSAEVASAIVASLSASIDQAVANGHITAERADQAKARLPERVERLMQRVPGQNAQQ